ncbi:hypothetical protein JS84_07180 [Vibrio vulnificus]|nr:hypothetical protein Y702_07095 [Vibrio vulnificus BAA87]KFK61165.1 hypothetical protein JS83_04090 [Vibrio vulnificus]KFK65274.1 hypothetical protein JS84_07180 [Vibrio vulnificus]KFK67838.1 hypothetical protein JS85_17905 [Vibrio vulnificus]POC54403.1 hypothetical protein CRN45_03270 [Vibrio vulnificus]
MKLARYININKILNALKFKIILSRLSKKEKCTTTMSDHLKKDIGLECDEKDKSHHSRFL